MSGSGGRPIGSDDIKRIVSKIKAVRGGEAKFLLAPAIDLKDNIQGLCKRF